MTELAVRPATAADVEAIVDLLESVVDEGRWLGTEPPFDRPEHLERLAAEVAEPEGSTLLVAASPGGEVVGHLRLSLRPYGVANLSMYVAAVWRGRGVGSALVAAALAAARASGAHKVALQAWPNNAAAIALYAKFGFVEEGRLRRHYRRRDGSLWDAVVMGLVLDEHSPGGPPASSAGRGHGSGSSTQSSAAALAAEGGRPGCRQEGTAEGDPAPPVARSTSELAEQPPVARRRVSAGRSG